MASFIDELKRRRVVRTALVYMGFAFVLLQALDIFVEAFLLPQIVYEIFFPDAFDVTAKRDSIDYEFRDPDLAQEFAELNSDAEWVEIE